MPAIEPDKRFIIPFAESGARNVIPQTTTEFGRASLKLGFPPETSVLVSQGGAAPKGSDFNGIFYHITEYLQWIQSGGQWTYDSGLDYAQPAIVSYNNIFYTCMSDNGPGTIAGVKPPTNSAYWSTLGANIIPAGTVLSFAMQKIPSGFIECNGAEISRTAYADLFAAIGTNWGGASATTFKLPDYRGKFLRGWDRGANVDNGRVFGNTQGDAIRNITGSFEIRKSFSTITVETIVSPSGAISRDVGGGDTNGTNIVGSQMSNRDRITFSAENVVPTANENRPVNETVVWCIKY